MSTKKIIEFRDAVKIADGILKYTPEYVFSIPSGLKNAIEWCVSTTVFSNKPLGFIMASASGERGLKELKLIMKTIEANFTEGTSLLIQGLKGKMDENGNITDKKTENELMKFVDSFYRLTAKLSSCNDSNKKPKYRFR